MDIEDRLESLITRVGEKVCVHVESLFFFLTMIAALPLKNCAYQLKERHSETWGSIG